MLTAELASLEDAYEEDPNAWQSDASLAAIEPRMLAMERQALTYEMPLLDALEDEYGDKIADRGWLVCGPGSVVLANLLEQDTRIPLTVPSRAAPKECLRMEMYIFNYFNDSALPPRCDHTNLQYDTGKGFVITIDPAYQLLWRNARKAPGAFLVEWHYSHYVRRDMQDFYQLRQVRPLPGYHGGGWPDVWGVAGRAACSQDSSDMLHVMHSPDVFEEVVQTRSGDIIEIGEFWGERLLRVLQTVRARLSQEQMRAQWLQSEADIAAMRPEY